MASFPDLISFAPAPPLLSIDFLLFPSESELPPPRRSFTVEDEFPPDFIPEEAIGDEEWLEDSGEDDFPVDAIPADW